MIWRASQRAGTARPCLVVGLAWVLASAVAPARAQPPGQDVTPPDGSAEGEGQTLPAEPEEGSGLVDAEGEGAPPDAEMGPETVAEVEQDQPERALPGGEEHAQANVEYHIRYFLERIEVHGNTDTRDYVVRRFVPIEEGDVLDVDDPAIETIRWRLLGTGFFSDVRLRLRRGTRRGWVILVIEVEERNTLVIEQIALGISQGVLRTTDTSTDLLPYAGVTLTETNLLGLGMNLSASALASKRQQGVRARFTDPLFLGSGFLFSMAGFYNNGREFFGDDEVRVSIVCPEPDPADPMEECPPEVLARNAVVFYQRGGMSLGTGHDISASARYTLDWQGELVNVRVRPEAASERRGDDIVPIDFAIEDDLSIVSAVQFNLIYDRRDDPALPTRGTLVRFRTDVASRLLGSDYSFLRTQTLIRHWVPLPWGGHHLRFSAFAGAVFGQSPFFYRFYASDLSDLIPSRILDMNIDSRAPPDLLGTAVAEMRSEELAARVDVEYGLPLYRGEGGLRALNAYFDVGVYALADHRDLRVAVSGYDGLARLPIDLTFDVGVRADTSVGVFQLGFSTMLGFFAP